MAVTRKDPASVGAEARRIAHALWAQQHPSGALLDELRALIAELEGLATAGQGSPVPPAQPHQGPLCEAANAVADEGDTWRALCAFLLTADEPMCFLRLWNEGSFEVCRREWPEAPDAVYPAPLSETKADGMPVNRVASAIARKRSKA